MANYCFYFMFLVWAIHLSRKISYIKGFGGDGVNDTMWLIIYKATVNYLPSIDLNKQLLINC